MKTKQAAVEGDPIADVVDFVAQSFNNGHQGMPVSHYLLENEAEAVKLVFPWWGYLICGVGLLLFCIHIYRENRRNAKKREAGRGVDT